MHRADICDNRNESQPDFAIVAISSFASFANTSGMNDLQRQQKLWLAAQIKAHGRGTRSALATHLSVRNDAITRMTNFGDGEARDISLGELVGMAEFFKSEPPGLAATKAAAGKPKDRKPSNVASVPLIDSVTAGKLTAPMSQIPIEDVPLLAFADLGRGEFFALKVEGSSMDRISPEGSVIVVNRADKTLVNGKCYVFNYRGETTFKQWHGGDPPYLAPYSTDPSHSPIFIKKKRDFEVIGRVKRSVLDL